MLSLVFSSRTRARCWSHLLQLPYCHRHVAGKGWTKFCSRTKRVIQNEKKQLVRLQSRYSLASMQRSESSVNTCQTQDATFGNAYHIAHSCCNGLLSHNCYNPALVLNIHLFYCFEHRAMSIQSLSQFFSALKQFRTFSKEHSWSQFFRAVDKIDNSPTVANTYKILAFVELVDGWNVSHEATSFCGYACCLSSEKCSKSVNIKKSNPFL